MTELALAVSFVVAAWWLSTAVVLRLVWLSPAAHRRVLPLMTVLALAGLYGAWALRDVASQAAAYGGFACALLVWAWHELTFLVGAVTGPRRTACPEGARGIARFRYATEAVIHHEIALAVTAAVMVAVSWSAANQVASQTFLVLWVMRLSAKLNLFLGVRNVSEEFVPDRLRYLVSYFRRASFNFLMPVSIAGSGVVSWMLWSLATTDGANAYRATAHALVASILTLALLEHLFLYLPVPDALLFRWVLRSERTPDPSATRAQIRSPLRSAIGSMPGGKLHDEA